MSNEVELAAIAAIEEFTKIVLALGKESKLPPEAFVLACAIASRSVATRMIEKVAAAAPQEKKIAAVDALMSAALPTAKAFLRIDVAAKELEPR